jgi:hypothetical protein
LIGPSEQVDECFIVEIVTGCKVCLRRSVAQIYSTDTPVGSRHNRKCDFP